MFTIELDLTMSNYAQARTPQLQSEFGYFKPQYGGLSTMYKDCDTFEISNTWISHSQTRFCGTYGRESSKGCREIRNEMFVKNNGMLNTVYEHVQSAAGEEAVVIKI